MKKTILLSVLVALLVVVLFVFWKCSWSGCTFLNTMTGKSAEPTPSWNQSNDPYYSDYN